VNYPFNATNDDNIDASEYNYFLNGVEKLALITYEQQLEG